MIPRLFALLAAGLLWAGLAVAQININTASPAELDALKGIGPVKAQAIVDYRTRNGPFRSVDDLQNVPGIGPETLKDVRGQVSVGGLSRSLSAPPAKKPEPANLPSAAPARPAAESPRAPAPVPAKPAAPAKPATAQQSSPASPVIQPPAPAAPARPANPAAATPPSSAAPAKPPAPARPANPGTPAKPAAVTPSPQAASPTPPAAVPARPPTPARPAGIQ